MNCVSCGTPNPDHAQTCLTCGKTLLEDQVTAPDIPIPNLTVEQHANEPIPAAADEATVQAQPIPAEQFVFDALPAASLAPEASTLSPVAEPFTAGQFLSSADAPMMDSEEGGLPPNVSSDIPPEIADTAPPVPPKANLRKIAQPLPLWAFLVGIVPIVGVLITVWFMGRDWAEGAWYVAIAADAIALLIALATGVRSLAGMAAKSNPHRLRQYVSSSLSILILLLCSMPGLAFQSSIHTAQGHYLETRQQWQAAIYEYQLGGDKKPTSENIARVYNEWGESLNQAQHYEDAIAKFDTVENDYGAVKTEVSRAQKGDIAAYLAWGKQAMQQKQYDIATQRFNDLSALPYCNAQCQQTVGPLNATAYYDLAEAELSDKDYTDAVSDFRLLQTHYPASPEAKLIHQDMAKALLGDALYNKNNNSSACSITIADYQDLIDHFSDTLQGAVAKLAMVLPQPVIGQFPPPIPGKADGMTPVVGLMKGLTPQTSNADFFAQFNGGNIPRTTVNADGTFKFALVPQGQYILVWGVIKSDGSENIYSGFDNVNEAVTVGPACPTDLGDVNWIFYTASDFPS